MKYDLNINSAIGENGLNPGIYPVIIYQLIRQYSNENNKIFTDDILDTLEVYWKGDTEKQDYRKNLQRTLKRNLETLLFFDSNIHAEYKDGTPYNIDSSEDRIGKIYQLWYEQEISPTDLQLLSDSVIYSKHLSSLRKQEILQKLMAASGQSNTKKAQWFQSVLKDAIDISIPVSEDLYPKLEYINDAIENKNCISFDLSFSGPNGQQYKLRSYTGVSPYKIVHDDGIYYLIGARNKDEEHQSFLKKRNRPYRTTYIKIHKMSKVRTDFNHNYLDISETNGDQRSLSDFLGSGFYRSWEEYRQFKFKSDVKLITSAQGLDILIDHFANRLHATKRSELDSRYAGNTPELAFTYDVKIIDVTRNDYYTLLSLMLYYSEKDIELIEPSHFLYLVKSLMEIRLNRLHKRTEEG